MADNIAVTAGAGTIIAADDIAGILHQRVKLSLGADGVGADAPIGGGVEAGVLRVTIASDSSGVLSIDDNGGALTVDGTVTSNLGATDNAVLDSIDASTSRLISSATNINAGSALATTSFVVGTRYKATPPTFTDGQEGALQIDSAGKLLTSSAVSAIVPGTAATNLGKAIDSVGGATDTGIVTLAIRDDSLTALTPVDGDYVALRVNSTGALHVTGGGGGTEYAVDTALGATPTGSLAIAIRDDALSTLTPVEGDAIGLRVNSTGALWVAPIAGAADKLDDQAFTLTTDSVVMIGAIRDDALAALAAAEGDAVPLRVSSTGALHVTGAGGGTQFAEDSAHTTADLGTLALAVRHDTSTTGLGVDGDYAALVLNANGRLFTTSTIDAALPAGTNNIGDVDILTIAAGDNNIGNVDIVTMPTVTVNAHAVTNAGTFATQVDGAALTALQVIDNPVLVDDAAFTPGTSSVTMAGFQADEASTDSVDEGDAGAARMTLTRKVIVNSQPHTAGGCLILKVLDNDETEDEIKATAGTLYTLYCFNSTNAILYVKLYNATAANVTVGTTTPVMTIPVPGNNDTDGAGVVLSWPLGVNFDTAITVATTTALADNDTGAPGANAMTLAGTYF